MKSAFTVRRESIFLALIVLLAGFLRFYRLDQVPPGLHFDEAFNIFDLLRLLRGEFAIFFSANFGRESFFFYAATVGASLFGAQALALRGTSAIIGTATIIAIYSLARALFRSNRIALLAELLTAISVWHIYYSRLGLRVILSVPFIALALFWFWRAMRSQQTRAYVWAGIATALATYTYTTGRLLPIILIAWTVFGIIADRNRWRVYVRGLVITGIVALVVFIPLGIYFVSHPDDFATHGSDLAIWNPLVNKGDLGGTLWNNLGLMAGAFFIRGDIEAFRNVPFHPIYDPLIAVLFLLSLALLLLDLFARQSPSENRLRAVSIIFAILVLISQSVLSDAPPNFTRTLPVMPLLMILPAWALSVAWNYISRLNSHMANGIVGIILMTSAALSFDSYFNNFANSPALYYAFDVRMFDVAHWINQNARTNTIYLAPLWFQQGTLSLLTRNAPPKSFESRDTIILPSSIDGKDALYAFPPEQDKKAAKLGERLGTLAERQIIPGSTGEPLLIVYRVPAKNLPGPNNLLAILARGDSFIQPQKIAKSVWGESLELFGYSIDATDAPKRNLEVTLFFRALKSIDEDYTFSIKVRDAQDRTWGQEDKWLGNNSYATTQMSAGDVIVEKFYPGLSACAPAGGYRITLEAYHPQTTQTWELTDGGNVVNLGETRAEASQGNRYEDLDPNQTIDIQPAPNAHLLGFTLTPDEARPGDAFSLSLFWRGIGDGKQTSSATIRLRDESKKEFVLAEKTLTLAPDGRGLCTLFDLQLPKESTPGTGTLFVNDTQVTKMNVIK